MGIIELEKAKARIRRKEEEDERRDEQDSAEVIGQKKREIIKVKSIKNELDNTEII